MSLAPESNFFREPLSPFADTQAVPAPFVRYDVAPVVEQEPIVVVEPEVLEEHFDVEPSQLLKSDIVYTSDDPQVGHIVRLAAQKTHTRVYLEKEFIEPEEVNDDGVYTQYADRSIYFYRKSDDRKREVSARQIKASKKGGILSMPTLHNFEIDPEKLKEAAGVEKLRDIKPKTVVEISALAARKLEEEGEVHETTSIKRSNAEPDLQAVLMTYSAMLRKSLEEGHELWTLNTYPALARKIGMLVGEEQMHAIGESRMYMGSVTTPYVIKPQDVVRKLLGSEDPKHEFHKTFLKKEFAGVDGKKIPDDIRELLTANNIEIDDISALRRMATNPKVIAVGGLAAYCSARAIPLGGVEEFKGSVAAFWAIDVVTAVPYPWALEQAAVGKTVARKAGGYALASTCFAAPYVYAYAEGQDYPAYVNWAIGGFVGFGVAKEAVSQVRNRRSEKHLDAELRIAHEDE